LSRVAGDNRSFASASNARVPCGSREDEEDKRWLRAELLRLEAEDGPACTRLERLV